MTAPLHAAANWYPDPLGRGEYRYWDGERWTHWIAIAGESRPDTFALPAGLPEPSLLGATPSGITAPAPGAAVLLDANRFRSLRGLSTALTWVLSISIAAAIVLVVACANRISKVDAYEDAPSAANLSAIDDADDFVSAAAGILVALGIAIFVLLVVFLYRASKNTEIWDRSSRTWTPGWTIAGWFIPLANFVIPPLVVSDIWRRTPDRSQVAAGTATRPSAGRVWLWWVPFAIGAVLNNVDIDADTFSEARTQDVVNIAGATALAIGAAVLVGIVRALARRQHATTPDVYP